MLGVSGSGMPVGFMCFKGLNLHEPEILSLLRDYPSTPVIIDHLGFFYQVTTRDSSLICYGDHENGLPFQQR